MRRSLSSVLCPLLLVVGVVAQAPAKRPLTHDDYDEWKSISSTDVTHDGKWIAVTIAAQDGDSVLEIRETAGDRVWRQPRGKSPAFTADGRFVAFLIDPSKKEQRAHKQKQLEKEKSGEGSAERSEAPARPAAPPAGGARGGRGGRGGAGAAAGGGTGVGGDDTAPKSSLGILELATGNVQVVERVKSFRVPEDGPAVVVYHLEKPLKKEGDEKKPEGEGKAEAKPEGKSEGKGVAKGEARTEAKSEGEAMAEGKTEGKSEAKGEGESKTARQESKPTKPDHASKRRQDGTALIVRDLTSNAEARYEGVTGFGLTRKRAFLWFTTSSKKDDPKVELGLFAIDLGSRRKTALLSGLLEAKSITTDRDEKHLAFLSNKEDFAAEKPVDDLYVWSFADQPAEKIVARDTPGLPPDRCVSSRANLSFSRNGAVLLFGAGRPPEADLPPILAEDKVTLDLWHWRDGLLQPMQSRRSEELRNRSQPCAWHVDGKRVVVLGPEELQSASFCGTDGSRVLAQDGSAYEREASWDGSYADVWLIATSDGTRKKLLTRHRGQARGSQGGRFVTYFGEDRKWHAIDLQTGADQLLAGAAKVAWHNEEHDQPGPAGAIGQGPWLEGDRGFLLYDRYDVWQVDPQGGEAVCVTDGVGRTEKTTFRYHELDPEREALAPDQQLLLSAAVETTRASGYFADRLGAKEPPRKLLLLDKEVRITRKPKQAARLLLTFSTFAEFPDLWTSDLEFGGLRRLTDANPQQKQIRWGSAELVSWINGDGVPLQGVLIKPEGFDPSRQYPMLVHFYERMSQSLHNYRAPSPGTSPNASYYVSNGYLWFMPDIVYRVGQPGESCFKCVVAGVQSLIQKGFVDPKRIGISGHSWGGYQVTYLVAHTTMFAAAEAGAPVANMTSAYGGIRWSTGMSRMWQYERTQSRIGGSLWDEPLRFLENSPIFLADKVRTPLLILHNDQDGAVPWYQGIEMFVALRRLGRECYLLNYVGEDHGLGRRANQKDYTRRMQEFFDCHLQGAPPARWMQEGVPFIARDREKVQYLKPAEKATEASATGSTGGSVSGNEAGGKEK
jgi:dipeptidyl aminopeptidase/acylaminoacyl peptidase